MFEVVEKRALVIYDEDDREITRITATLGESIIQRQVIGGEGGEPILEIALCDVVKDDDGKEKTGGIKYAYGIPVVNFHHYEFLTFTERLTDHEENTDEVPSAPAA